MLHVSRLPRWNIATARTPPLLLVPTVLRRNGSSESGQVNQEETPIVTLQDVSGGAESESALQNEKAPFCRLSGVEARKVAFHRNGGPQSPRCI